MNELETLGDIATQECMRAAGFDYFPTVVDWIPVPLPASPTREIVAVEGLGISARWASDYPEDPETADPADQNQEYERGLTSAEQHRYWRVLGGDAPRRAATGCVGAGQIDANRFTAVWQALRSELFELETAFDADPRMEEIRSAWLPCMSDAGYPGLDIDQARTDIAVRLSAIFDAPGVGPMIIDNETGEELIHDQVIEIITDEETGERVTSDGRGTVIDVEPDQDLLDALAAEERSLALAGFDCRAITQPAQSDIEAGYRAAFIEENETVIDELIASVVPG